MTRHPKKPTEKKKMPATASREGQKALGVYIDEKLADALAAYVETTRPKPSKTSVIEAALEEYLTARGAYPPPGAADE